ncbi:GNAT family N-acetyltransferase [Colwellia sp. D2M02]|uniref:GNAT family N-acetyltransferase n=1 Tax=Colwellia sp. D2M02 TaxID=2841562 RepID=UPI0020917D88|nr:GNAT family N-acetyltransferase [Colwellia sp. D2M02]
MIAEQKLTVLSTGQRIALSLFDVSDMPLFIDISMSKQMMKHVYAPLTQQAATEAFVERSQPWTLQSDHWLSLGINDIFSGEKLGSIGLKIVNHSAKIAEVGFMIKTSAQGKGYASEALSLLMHIIRST